jgi:hypothetical protein
VALSPANTGSFRTGKVTGPPRALPRPVQPPAGLGTLRRRGGARSRPGPPGCPSRPEVRPRGSSPSPAAPTPALAPRCPAPAASVMSPCQIAVIAAASCPSQDRGIANSGPQVPAPAIVAPLVSQLGGYPTLFLSVAVITVLGSAFVWKIRSVP